jgi:hypothetical protein
MGRPSALTPQQQAEARKRRDEGATLKGAGPKLEVTLAQFSPHGRRVVTASVSAAWLWDAVTGKLMGEPDEA